jgi:hypothetical protein
MGSQGQAVIDRLLARVADLEFCEHAPRDGPRDQHPADEHASSTQQKQTFPDMAMLAACQWQWLELRRPAGTTLKPAKPISKARI